MNKKDLRIKKLWDRGFTDLRVLAHKVGYTGSATDAGIERVKEALRNWGVSTEEINRRA